MPWKECHVMDERLRFVARLLEGEKMAPLCAAFGISRKTGYKIFERYKDCGLGAFTDRSRRPYRQANRLPAPLEATIVRLKREYPGWGALSLKGAPSPRAARSFRTTACGSWERNNTWSTSRIRCSTITKRKPPIDAAGAQPCSIF